MEKKKTGAQPDCLDTEQYELKLSAGEVGRAEWQRFYVPNEWS